MNSKKNFIDTFLPMLSTKDNKKIKVSGLFKNRRLLFCKLSEENAPVNQRPRNHIRRMHPYPFH